ncbi:MAG: hypothetical protein HY985_19385 [Magnetospirillum sp.]|nr:hypothetical protein [Magnetospirillum sp.]
MSEPARSLPDGDDATAEASALVAAVAEARADLRADLRAVPHAEVRAWLLEIAAGNFDATPPEAGPL